MEKKKKVKFTTSIDKELLKKIKVKAIEEGKNVNEIIEELFDEYLKSTISNKINTKVFAEWLDKLAEENKKI